MISCRASGARPIVAMLGPSTTISATLAANSVRAAAVQPDQCRAKRPCGASRPTSASHPPTATPAKKIDQIMQGTAALQGKRADSHPAFGAGPATADRTLPTGISILRTRLLDAEAQLTFADEYSPSEQERTGEGRPRCHRTRAAPRCTRGGTSATS